MCERLHPSRRIDSTCGSRTRFHVPTSSECSIQEPLLSQTTPKQTQRCPTLLIAALIWPRTGPNKSQGRTTTIARSLDMATSQLEEVPRQSLGSEMSTAPKCPSPVIMRANFPLLAGLGSHPNEQPPAVADLGAAPGATADLAVCRREGEPRKQIPRQ